MTTPSARKRSVVLGFSVTPAEEQIVKRMMVEQGYPSVSQFIHATVNGVLTGRSAVEEDRQAMLAELVQASQAIAAQTAKQIASEFAKREATATAEHDRRMKTMEGFQKAALTGYSAQISDLKHTITQVLSQLQQQ